LERNKKEKSETPIDRIQKQTKPAPDLANRSEKLKEKKTRAELPMGRRGDTKKKKKIRQNRKKRAQMEKEIGAIWVGA
jgi:hypothetical protein